MSVINQRLLDALETGDYSPQTKKAIKQLLAIELRNMQSKKFQYSKEYDIIITKLAREVESANEV